MIIVECKRCRLFVNVDDLHHDPRCRRLEIHQWICAKCFKQIMDEPEGKEAIYSQPDYGGES